jgi:para-nitrobenzyl esterase
MVDMTRVSAGILRCALAAILLAESAALAVAGVMHPVAGDPVRIDSGLVAGTLLGHGVKAYLGVPFAAPPVRQNRWRPPRPVAPWTGIYTADTRRPECMQPLRSSDINHYFGEEAISEDCLYLNVWAPERARAGDNLPVVVWIYGGAFSIGSATSPAYAGAPLARKGVVYVAANYRVGPLGFLALPQLTAESARHASGDWGLLDQIAALHWVQRNIRAFGGNPANVTVAGQSAGSMSINILQASPLAAGLFRRLIGMSGSTVLRDSMIQIPSLAQAEAEGEKLERAMHTTSLTQMRALSSDRLLAIARQAHARAMPDVDGYVLPENPRAIFEAGRQADVPILVGSTANDIGTDIPLRKASTPQQYRDLAATAFGSAVATFLQLWPADSDAAAARRAQEVARDSGFGLAAISWATLQATTGKAPAYVYMFARIPPFAPGVTFSDFDPATAGAYHMSDVPYWLGSYPAFNLFRVTRDWTPLDRSLSEKMQDVIVAFAKTGDPGTADVEFRRFEPGTPWRTVFGDTVHLQKLNAKGVQFLLEHPPAAVARPPQAPRTAF